MMKRFIAAAITFLALAGCSASDLGLQQKQSDPGRKCADLFVKGYTTDGATKGVWDCIGKDRQNTFHAYGIDGDQALTGIAALHHQQFVMHDLHSPKGDSYLYRVWEADAQGKVGVGTYMVVYTDASGKVSSWQFAQ